VSDSFDSFGGVGRQKPGSSSHPILPIVALVALLALLGFFALSHGSSESSLGQDLQRHGVRTVGTVTVVDQSNHDHFEYSYTVERSQYSGDSGSFTSAESEGASQYQVGQHIAVTYDAKDPTQSCSCDVDLLASSSWANDLFPVFFGIPVIAALAIVLLVRNRRRQRAEG
jgi:Protein of unknown function (DUF3592)